MRIVEIGYHYWLMTSRSWFKSEVRNKKYSIKNINIVLINKTSRVEF